MLANCETIVEKLESILDEVEAEVAERVAGDGPEKNNQVH
jgi:hypothetical protein